MIANENHKSCRRTLLSRIARLAYIVHQLQDMKHDNCPAVWFPMDDLDRLQDVITKLRRKAETK